MSLPIQKALFNIVTTILIMGGYVLYVFGINGETNIPKIEELEFWGKFMLMIIGVTIVAKIILMIIYSIFRAARHGDEENIDFMDERDKLIEMKSERNGNFLIHFWINDVNDSCSYGIPRAIHVHYSYFFRVPFRYSGRCLKNLLLQQRDIIWSKEHIENNIRTLRFFKNEMTQQQLADEVGVTRQTIAAIEAGKYSPTLELAFRIASVFEVTLDEVFKYNRELDKFKKRTKKKK
jgi:putative transcriptional regulator